MEIKKTSGQKWFEQFAPIMLQLLADLTDEQRKQVFNYIVDLSNFNTTKVKEH